MRYHHLNPGALDLFEPPIFFEGVVMRIFPLRLHVARLERFCHNVLNIFDEYRFRPATSFAFLQLINYGSMSPKAIAAGWAAQNELVISIPMEQYRRHRDGWRFERWVSWAPFVFVDSDESILTGREVIGWPKVHGGFQPELSPWALHPTSHQHMVSFSADVLPELYAGQRLESRVILEIERQAIPSWSEFPPTLDRMVGAPYRGLRRVGLTSFWSALDLFWRSTRLRIDPLDDMMSRSVDGGDGIPAAPQRDQPKARRKRARIDPLGEMAKLWKWIELLVGMPTINLKQFRDTAEPTKACFQALTTGVIRARDIDGWGLLGDLRMAMGDWTGGYRVNLPQYEAYPMVERLGLIPSRNKEVGGVPVAMLDPILPFWVSLDMEYLRGYDLISRPSATSRSLKLGELPGGDERSATKDGAASAGSASGLPAYVEVRDGALASRASATASWEASIFVYPLVASRTALTRFCKAYELGPGLEIRPWQGCLDADDRIPGFPPWVVELMDPFRPADNAIVYMVVVVHARTSSKGDDIGIWAEHEVAFHLPIRIVDSDATGALESRPGSLVTYSFKDSGVAVVTSREVYGWPTTFASFEQPGHGALMRGGPLPNQGVLEVRTEVSNALTTGQGLTQRTLIEIHHGSKSKRRRQSPAGEEQEVESVLDWLDKAEPSGGNESDSHLDLWGLKQVRAMDAPSSVCYRSLAQTRCELINVSKPERLGRAVSLRIHRYPTHPIVEQLGLRRSDLILDESREPGRVWEGAAVEVVEPVEPFRFTASYVLNPTASFLDTESLRSHLRLSAPQT